MPWTWYSLAIALSPYKIRKFWSLFFQLEDGQHLPREQSEGLHLVGGRYVCTGADDDQMIETECENRLEALHARSGRSGDRESIDECVIEELRVTGVSARMPRHVVRFANFLSDRTILGA